jgi:peptide/nickel transport system permease protein
LARWLGLIFLLPAVIAAVAAPHLAPANPFAGVGDPFQPPSTLNWLGTDDLGRDLLSGVFYGART